MNLESLDHSLPGGSGVSLAVHGGAWDIPVDCLDEHRRGIESALLKGRGLLLAGVSADQVVVEVVEVMENNGAFDAGRGSVLTSSGTVEMDAGVMCGETGLFGSVACVTRLAGAVRPADFVRRYGRGQFRFLIGRSADDFGVEHGLAEIDPASLICEREKARFEKLFADARRFHQSHVFLPDLGPSGTVGCVARDKFGRLASATSTGGTPFRRPGRVGDTPLPGCGFYATKAAAASATGWGEAIAAIVMSYHAVAGVEVGTPIALSARDSVVHLGRRIANPEGREATGGIIVIDSDGRIAIAFSTPRMARGWWRSGEDVYAAV